MTCYRREQPNRLNLTAILEKVSKRIDNNGVYLVSISLLIAPKDKVIT
ncbi:MAG: hypothetical protein ACJA2J_000341 [Candidatus Azotimanducaceae bacterium]|jgi:hypothetical protein